MKWVYSHFPQNRNLLLPIQCTASYMEKLFSCALFLSERVFFVHRGRRIYYTGWRLDFAIYRWKNNGSVSPGLEQKVYKIKWTKNRKHGTWVGWRCLFIIHSAEGDRKADSKATRSNLSPVQNWKTELTRFSRKRRRKRCVGVKDSFLPLKYALVKAQSFFHQCVSTFPVFFFTLYERIHFFWVCARAFFVFGVAKVRDVDLNGNVTSIIYYIYPVNRDAV